MNIKIAYFISFLTLLPLGFFVYHASHISLQASPGSSPDQVIHTEAVLSPMANKGETLFKANCATCHRIDRRLVGPKLAGAKARYQGQEAWLYAWVRNSQKLVKSGDPQALQLFKENNQQIMSAFPNLSDEDIEALFVYADEASSL